MNPIKVHLVRDGLELGVLPLDAVRTLLTEGFLKPTDEFWAEGMKDREFLSTLESSLAKAESRSFKALAARAAATTRAFAGEIAERSTALTRTVTVESATVTNKLLEDSLPWIQTRLLAKLASLGRTSASAMQDEEFLHKLFGALYDCIPKPVYRFVSEQQFIEFCHKHRKQLLGSEPGKPS